MKVLYDHQTFSAQRYGGISRYFFELMKHYRENNSLNVQLGLKYTNNDYLVNSDFKNELTVVNKKYLHIRNFLPAVQFKGKGRLFRVFNKVTGNIEPEFENNLYSIKLLKEQNFDIFHPTYYNPYFLNYIQTKPFVITVYDMIHEIYPEYFHIADPTWGWKRTLINKATKIIAISENTKKDILKFYDVDESKIEVIHLNSNIKNNLDLTKEKVNLPKKYIMFVGTRVFYKNFYFFLQCAAKLIAKDKDLNIVCAGGGEFTATEDAYIDKLGLSSNIFYFDASDNNLAHLYSNAEAFIYPSMYEGFGIPVLEAYEFNCPVLCSNTSSFNEVAGDAAEYFDPKDANSMIKAIENVIYNKDRQNELITLGHKREKLFSVEKTTEKTLALYKSI
jgi:glycosyltransferase involved in cell wall biosynthesis